MSMRADTWFGSIKLWAKLALAVFIWSLVTWGGTAIGLFTHINLNDIPSWAVIMLMAGGFAYLSICERLREINERLRSAGFDLEDDPDDEDEL